MWFENITISWRGRDGATGYERAGSGDFNLLTLDYSETGPVEIAVTFSSNTTTITKYLSKAIFIGSLVPRPSPLSAHCTRASCAHADSYARGRPGLKHHVR